jgi:hypothetical protein
MHAYFEEAEGEYKLIYVLKENEATSYHKIYVSIEDNKLLNEDMIKEIPINGTLDDSLMPEK